MMDQNNLSVGATPVTPPSPQSDGDNMLAGQIIPDPSTTATAMSNDTTGATPQPSTVPGMTVMPSAPVTDTMSVPTTALGMPSPVGMGANALDPMSGAATVSAPSPVSNPTVEAITVPTPLDMPAVPPVESVVTPMASAIAADTTSISDTGTGLNAYVSSQKNSLAGSAPAAVADPLNIADNSQPQTTTNPLAASVSSAVNEPASTPTISATPTMDLPSTDSMSGSAPSSFVLDYNKPQSAASTADVPTASQPATADFVGGAVSATTPATNAEPSPSNVLNDIGVAVDPTDSTEVGAEMKLDLNAPAPDPATTALPGVVEMPGPAIGTQPSNVAPLEQGLDTINMQKGADVVTSQPDIGLNQTIANMVTNENQSPLTQPQAVVQPAKKNSGKVFVMFSLILVVVVVALVLIMVGLNFIG